MAGGGTNFCKSATSTHYNKLAELQKLVHVEQEILYRHPLNFLLNLSHDVQQLCKLYRVTMLTEYQKVCTYMYKWSVHTISLNSANLSFKRQTCIYRKACVWQDRNFCSVDYNRKYSKTKQTVLNSLLNVRIYFSHIRNLYVYQQQIQFVLLTTEKSDHLHCRYLVRYSTDGMYMCWQKTEMYQYTARKFC